MEIIFGYSVGCNNKKFSIELKLFAFLAKPNFFFFDRDVMSINSIEMG